MPVKQRLYDTVTAVLDRVNWDIYKHGFSLTENETGKILKLIVGFLLASTTHSYIIVGVGLSMGV